MKTILKLLFVIGLITFMYQIYFGSREELILLDVSFGLILVSFMTLTLSKCFKERKIV